MSLIEQEMSTDHWIKIPEEVRDGKMVNPGDPDEAIRQSIARLPKV
jgi:predicted alternative tryptophan synthase beta-subunit